ncbi:hypothetical protein [Actinokineospora sp.]|uniref:hypothetical protein n=1 Tax=Actinokineospora sp. TaxID=1872133 RepID=UPI003D6AAE22
MQLNELELAARVDTGTIPYAASLLRAPVSDLFQYDDFYGSGRFDAAYDVQAAYESYVTLLAERQAKACNIIDASAESLREIIALYRRVDGQG